MIFASQVLKVAIFALFMLESANSEGISPLPDHGIGESTFRNLVKDFAVEPGDDSDDALGETTSLYCDGTMLLHWGG